jgi:hypothetical protein
MSWSKSQKIVTPRIASGDTRPSLWLWTLALLTVGLWTWQVYDYGLNYPGYTAASRADATQQLHERIADLEQEREELRFQSAKYERAGQIDREATLAIRAQITSLQNELSDLEREAASLRTLVTDGGDSLQVKDYALRKTADAERYHYAFTVSRDIEGAKKVEGWVKLRLVGEADGEPQELSLTDLGSGEPEVHKLGFKHYQRLEGDLQLPSGFTPSQLTIDVTPVGTQFKPFSISYDWGPTE